MVGYGSKLLQTARQLKLMALDWRTQSMLPAKCYWQPFVEDDNNTELEEPLPISA